MKVVLLAGGFGTRISEESQFKPKPMISIGGMPILWHIMKEYAAFGYDDFIVCAGYKQEYIKEYFSNYYLHNSNITFDFKHENKVTVHENASEPWNVTIVDTGLNTMTGGRVKRIAPYVGNETFMLTYGDGVCDVPIDKLVEFHRSHGRICTMTAVKPEGRFGILDIDGSEIKSFREKSKNDVGYINGGYMVLEPEIFDYISDDSTTFEREPLERIAKEGQLMAFKHNGFWQCMDTLRDREKLEKLWATGNAPWKVWENDV
ncbi:glucose-1-phosphate cytidylyltransferase [Veillonellaceae bacterium WCA-693-APC-5D-A]|uniref:Glucose-1-phosphate cytidylyltransferase n=1 Tax=Anaerovibrio slackiae TaxID=2652309 RepID=A0A6I2UJ15_9FIRM|nr:glucose-1-phosphate cytidylyltransferase [Anaerovibrio slackiae]MSU09151.1 glucose-1-phosphate cytidylyltransferase [Anaerovibrio slackiae]